MCFELFGQEYVNTRLKVEQHHHFSLYTIVKIMLRKIVNLGTEQLKHVNGLSRENQSNDADNRCQRPLFALDGTCPRKIVGRGFRIGMKLGDKARHPRSVCPIDRTAGFQQISFLYRNNRKILEEITDNKYGDQPIHIRDKADTQAEQKITEIERIANITIGTCCNEIAGGTEGPCTGGCSGISDRPYSEKLTDSNEQRANAYGVPHRFSKIEECENERDRRETANFEEEVANSFNFPCGSVKSV